MRFWKLIGETRSVLVVLVIAALFWFFSPWQTLVLIGIGGLILAILYTTGYWKPVRRFEFDATGEDDKKKVWERWSVTPAQQQFRRDVCIFDNLADYHEVFEYKIDVNRISIRLVEDTIEPAGKPLLYRVRDGIVGTSWIADYYPSMPEFGIDAVERLKNNVEWHDAPQGIRYLILKHTPGYRDFLSSERERLKRGVSNAEAELKRRGITKDADGVYVGPDGPEDGLVRSLLSDDHLSKYGITQEEFYSSGSLLRILRKF